MQAVKTNVEGTQNVIRAAGFNSVKKVICLSTDKAAYPINAMGISKAMMEKVAIAESRNLQNTIVCLTRYGNVMASRGSVIPLFINQIKSGLPLTITDPNMTRFLMSLNDAVDLVLFAFENGNQGDLFVNKAPAATIGDLAKAIKKLAKVENEINIIGTRHGEKLYESLLSREEFFKAKDIGRFYKVPNDGRDLNYSLYFSEGNEGNTLSSEYTSHNTERLSKPDLKRLLLSLDFVKKALGT